jgi:hypothetical protein
MAESLREYLDSITDREMKEEDRARMMNTMLRFNDFGTAAIPFKKKGPAVALADVAASALASVIGEKDAVTMSPICKALKAASEAANKKNVSPVQLFLGEEEEEEEEGGGGATEGAAKGVAEGGGGGGDKGADGGGGLESNTHDRAEGSMGTRKRGRVVEQQQQQQQQQQEEGVQKRGRGRPKKRNVVSL